MVSTGQVLREAGRSAESKEGALDGGWQERPLRKHREPGPGAEGGRQRANPLLVSAAILGKGGARKQPCCVSSRC